MHQQPSGTRPFISTIWQSGLACLMSASVAFGCGTSTRDPQYVAVELVLAVDTSISISQAEYQLQMTGIANALRSADIVDLVSRQPGGVAVSLVHWSVGSLNRQAVGWHHLCDLGSVVEFARQIETAPRLGAGRATSIGDAIRFSVKQMETNAFASDIRKIDISGDSRSNSGPSPAFARDAAVAKGITVNGLAIADGDRQLPEYFLAYVVGGTDSFVMSVDRHRDFADAMRRKLGRELQLQLSAVGPQQSQP